MNGNRARSPAGRLALAAAAAVALAGACAPSIDTPEQAGHQRDLRDAERIAQQLLQVPMIEAAQVTLTRGVADPLRAHAAPLASASAVLRLDSRADPAAIAVDVRALVTAVAPEVPSERVTVIARPRPPPPPLVQVGPFQIARASRRPLQATLLGLLALCAGLGATLAVRERSRRAGPPRPRVAARPR